MEQKCNATDFLQKDWIARVMTTGEYRAVLSVGDFDDDFTLFFRRVADELSAVVQSSVNPDTRNVTSITYGSKIYFQVRWP